MTQTRELIDAVNLLCRYAFERLPPLYQLSLDISDGEASLALVDPDGTNVDWCLDGGSCWEAACDAANEDAKRREKEPSK